MNRTFQGQLGLSAMLLVGLYACYRAPSQQGTRRPQASLKHGEYRFQADVGPFVGPDVDMRFRGDSVGRFEGTVTLPEDYEKATMELTTAVGQTGDEVGVSS